VVNTWGMTRCGHYRNLKVFISVGGEWNFTNSTVTCFRSHRKLCKIKHMTTSIDKNNRTQTREDVNQFVFIAEGQILANTKWAHLRGHPAYVDELAVHLYVFGVCAIHALVWLTWGELTKCIYAISDRFWAIISRYLRTWWCIVSWWWLLRVIMLALCIPVFQTVWWFFHINSLKHVFCDI